MSQESEYFQEVQQELVKLKAISSDSRIMSYNQITGGGSTNSIFELCFENPSVSFIQKVYNHSNYNKYAELEYTNLKELHNHNINVPQPYFLKLTPNTRDKPYFVMAKVDGPRLVDVKEANPKQYEELIERLIEELFKIHNLDTKSFLNLSVPNIQQNPFAPIDDKLKKVYLYIERYPEDLKELTPVADWLERKKENYPCKNLVVIHGDYHSFNILVQDNQDFKIIDCNAIIISDFRMDVAYTATTESYTSEHGFSYKDRMQNALMIAHKYEQISGMKVKGLSYFMILTCMFNLVRLYSQINNPSITSENEVTKDFFRSVYDYFLFLAAIIKENCNIELNQVQSYFEKN